MQLIETQQPAADIQTLQTNRGTTYQPKRAEKKYIMFKSITLAAVVIAASASIASASSNYISTFAPSQERTTEVELGLVVAEANGVVEIRDYRNGQIGKLLGSEVVRAGGNPAVDVEITPSFGDAIAILKVGDNVVDTQALNFSQHN